MMNDHFIMNASKLRFPIFSIYPTCVFPLFHITFSHPSIHILPVLTSSTSSPYFFLFFLPSSFCFFFPFSIRLTRKIRLRQIRISRQNKRFNLRQSIQRIIAESQMILDRLLGRQSQPLRDGNVVVDG